jgi:hypothetical protein
MSATKIGTEVFGVRVVSGSVRSDETGSIVLRQLYPGRPADIGVIDSIENGTGEVTVYPGHRREWTERDRSALAAFFVACYTDRYLDCLSSTASSASPSSTSLPSEVTDDRAA